jgi:hypothetical protein
MVLGKLIGTMKPRPTTSLIFSTSSTSASCRIARTYARLSQAAICLASRGRCGLAGAIYDPFLVIFPR